MRAGNIALAVSGASRRGAFRCMRSVAAFRVAAVAAAVAAAAAVATAASAVAAPPCARSLSLTVSPRPRAHALSLLSLVAARSGKMQIGVPGSGEMMIACLK